FGFANGDSLDLTNVGFDPNYTAAQGANNVLQITENGVSYSFKFDPNQNFTGKVFGLSPDGADGTLITQLRAAPADFYGIGTSDILWRNDSGAVYLWGMSGTGRIAAGSPGSATTDWHINGVGDFDGDGKSDILWRNDNGAVYI